MKSAFLLVLIVLSIMLIHTTTSSMEIKGGRIEDVLVLLPNPNDSIIITEFKDGWLSEGPNDFDVDKDGNVYILDQLGKRVQKYDRNGKWQLTISVGKEEPWFREKAAVRDIAVDDCGNIYVTTGNTFKFSSEGKLLFRIPTGADKRKDTLGYGSDEFIAVDEDGRVYNFGSKFWGGIDIYTSEGEHKANIYFEHEYPDRVITQKEVDNDIYFRVKKYLMKTTLEDFLKKGKLDKVAVVPDYIGLRKYAKDKVREIGWVENPFALIGYDKNGHFYFHKVEYWYKDRDMDFCQIHSILRYRLEKGKLVEPQQIEIYFRKSKEEECTDKGLRDFIKQFIVTGDGTIYWLHGTVDTVKVSKIIMDEYKPPAK